MKHKGSLMASAIRFLAAGALALLFSPTTASADYIAIGSFQGEECTNYLVIEKCEMRSVDAVEGEDGRLYTLQTRYPNVSRHWTRKNGTGMCRINLKAQSEWGFGRCSEHAVWRP